MSDSHLDELSHKREQLAQFAHDLSTPLSAARMLVEVLNRPGASPEKLKDIAAHLGTMLNRANDVVEEVLEEYQGYPDESPFVASVALRDAMVACASATRVPESALTLNIQEDFELRGPSKALYRAIQNLVKNACNSVKSVTDGRAPRVDLTVSREETLGVIEIRDTGVGISDEQLARIWEPRYTNSAVRGYGIGLSVVHKVIVSRCLGAISVESKPGEGACFTVRLPLRAK